MKKVLSIVLCCAFMLISSIMLFGCGKEYTITVDSQITNGQVTVSKTKAKKGEIIEVTPTAHQGYYLNLASFKANEQLIVDYKFVMPDEDVVITAEFTLPGLTHLNMTYNLQTYIESMQENYVNKPNTLGGEEEIVPYNAETMEEIFYTSIYPVDEKEDYTVIIGGQTVENQLQTIALGNNRFFELDLYKKDGDRFLILNPALVPYVQEGEVVLFVDNIGKGLILDFQRYNELSILAVHNGQDEVAFDEFAISTSFSADMTLDITVDLFENPVIDSYIGYSYLVLNFADETTKTIHTLSHMTQGVLSLNLLTEFLPEGKTLLSIDVFSHIFELGFLNYQIVLPA